MNVLVIGDSCEDVFIYGDIERISPEAPIPVFKPTHEESNGGMARNVANNVESLDMYIYTITNENCIIKKRFVENRSGQMVLRVDEHDYCDRIKIKRLQGITNNKFTSYSLTGTIDKIDAIIISDYCKGFLEESDIEHICKYNKNVFVDTKKKLDEWIKDADYIKINELEYKKNHELLLDCGFEDKLIVTLGSKGCKWSRGYIYCRISSWIFRYKQYRECNRICSKMHYNCSTKTRCCNSYIKGVIKWLDKNYHKQKLRLI